MRWSHYTRCLNNDPTLKRYSSKLGPMWIDFDDIWQKYSKDSSYRPTVFKVNWVIFETQCIVTAERILWSFQKSFKTIKAVRISKFITTTSSGNEFQPVGPAWQSYNTRDVTIFKVVSKDQQKEMAYGESNGHVTDDFTWAERSKTWFHFDFWFLY